MDSHESFSFYLTENSNSIRSNYKPSERGSRNNRFHSHRVISRDLKPVMEPLVAARIKKKNRWRKRRDRLAMKGPV